MNRRKTNLTWLWNQYITSDQRDEIMLLKKIKRHQKKYCSKKGYAKRRAILHQKETLNLKIVQQDITIETCIIKLYKLEIADDLSPLIRAENQLREVTFSRTVLFQCPICYDDEKTIDVVLHCGHCLCRECHATLSSTSAQYNCPTCREKISNPLLCRV